MRGLTADDVPQGLGASRWAVFETEDGSGGSGEDRCDSDDHADTMSAGRASHGRRTHVTPWRGRDPTVDDLPRRRSVGVSSWVTLEAKDARTSADEDGRNSVGGAGTANTNDMIHGWWPKVILRGGTNPTIDDVPRRRSVAVFGWPASETGDGSRRGGENSDDGVDDPRNIDASDTNYKQRPHVELRRGKVPTIDDVFRRRSVSGRGWTASEAEDSRTGADEDGRFSSDHIETMYTGSTTHERGGGPRCGEAEEGSDDR